MPIIRTYYKVHRVFSDPDYFYMENTSGSTATFMVGKNGTPASTDLSYSFDKVTWTDIHTGGNIQNVADGAKVYFRSSTGFNGESAYFGFHSNGDWDAGGHIATLFNYLDVDSVTSIPNWGLYRMFGHPSGYTPNIVHANVDFYGIDSIGDYGCYLMFRNCSKLVSIPDFSGISSFGQTCCESMFDGCTSLQTPLDLSGCTTSSDRQFRSLYTGCTSIADAIAPNVQSWDNNTFYNWLYNTAATGVVRKPAGLTIPTDSVSGVPTGWVTEDY